MESPENSIPQKNNNNIKENQHKLKKKSRINNQRRFSDDQIKSLDSIFKIENKLEPRKKLEIAKDLGLHPRQVAIWFQNRRARYKSKQLEQDYHLLKANYDDLNFQFDNLKTENQSLQIQLQELLNGVVKNRDDGYNMSYGDAELKEFSKGSSNEGMGIMINNYFEMIKSGEEHILRWSEEEMSRLTSPEKWCVRSSDGGGLFDELSESSSWWES